VILRIGDPIPTDGMRVHDHEILTRQLYERVAELAQGAYGRAGEVEGKPGERLAGQGTA